MTDLDQSGDSKDDDFRALVERRISADEYVRRLDERVRRQREANAELRNHIRKLKQGG